MTFVYTHTDDVKSTSNHIIKLVFLFSYPPNPYNKPFEFLMHETDRLHFPVRANCNRSQKPSQREKNKSHATRLRLVSHFLFFSRCDIICDPLLLYSTHGNLFVN